MTATIHLPPFQASLMCVRCGRRAAYWAETQTKLEAILGSDACKWHRVGDDMLCGEGECV